MRSDSLNNRSEHTTTAHEELRTTKFAFDTVPEFGKPLEVLAGVWWMRLPISGPIGHVNVYLIECEDGLSLVDTGSNTETIQQLFAQLASLGSPFDQPIRNVYVTHYHPDHIGMAGFFCERGASLHTSRTCWLQSKVLWNEWQDVPNEDELRFVESAGLTGVTLEAYRRRPPSNYRRLVSRLPFLYHRIDEEHKLEIGNYTFQVLKTSGHAADHLSFYSLGHFALTGDQVLPGISSNLSSHPSDPNSDLIADWIKSCKKTAQTLPDDLLCLPGHNSPFYGASSRCRQILSNLERTLDRLLDFLIKPRTAFECLEVIYGRTGKHDELALMIAEAVAYLHHLHRSNHVKFFIANNTKRWIRTGDKNIQIANPEL